MRICIIQSCYIPWRGFFDLIGRCEEYVIYDSVQYSKGHWHNRNRIKTANGVKWLTIPVETAGRLNQSISEVKVAGSWADKHWHTLELAYKNAPFFNQLAPLVKGWYERADKQELLSDVNIIFLQGIAEFLRLKTRIVKDDIYLKEGTRMERLLAIARAAGADRYLSGPSAQGYFDESMFKAAGITTEWMDYHGYQEYPQQYCGFESTVTVLDLIFNVGPEAQHYFKSGSEGADV